MRKPVLIALAFVLCASFLTAQEEDTPDALLRYNQGRYDEAIQICLQELEAMPKRMDAYVVLGWSHLKLGNWEEALDAGIRGRNVSRSDPRIVEIIGEAQYHLGEDLSALSFFEEYTVLSPTGSRIDDVYYYMGELFIRLGEYNHADIAFSTAVYHSPNNSNWWARLGYAREMAEDPQYALEAYERALKLNPTSSEASRGKDRVSQVLSGA